MKEEKSWIGWFIEDWGKYSHALVLLYYLYPIFLILSFPFIAPEFVVCTLSLIVSSVKIPTLKAVIVVVVTLSIYAFGFVIQWLWNRKTLVER